MNGAPLIPKSCVGERNDSLPLTRELFLDKFSKNVDSDKCSNLSKYNSEYEDIKLCAQDISQSEKCARLTVTEVEKVEEKILDRKAEYLISTDIIGSHNIIKEGVKLKRLQIIGDLDRGDVHKYALLQKNDVFANEIKNCLDFTYNSKLYSGEVSCSERKDIPIIKSTAAIVKKTPTYKTNVYESENEIFQVFPSSVVLFDDYDINETYKQTFRVTNVSKSTGSFTLISKPQTNYFTVEQIGSKNSRNVAPGLSVHYLVKYYTNVYLNIEDFVEIQLPSKTGKCVIRVRLYSYRQPPMLKGLVIKSLSNLDKSTANYLNYSEIRAAALCFTLDCGRCLLGSLITVDFVLRNYGSDGKFIILTEAEWFNGEITNITVGNELNIQPTFSLFPAYFRLDRFDYQDIVITFTPDIFGVCNEHLYFLCDNNTFVCVDLLADGVIFERVSVLVTSESFIRNDNNEKSAHDEPDYIIDFEQCLQGDQFSRTITVINNRLFDLNFRWQLYETCICDLNEEKPLPFEWINIKSGSVLPQLSTTDFKLELKPDYSSIGKHSVYLILLIENIPELSLQDTESFLINRTFKNDIDSQIVDVAVCVIEITCEIIQLFLNICPYVINLEMVPDRFKYTKCHIRLYSTGRYVLNCKWELADSELTVEPSEFALDDFFVDCYFNMPILSKKGFKENIVLNVNNGRCKITFEVNLIGMQLIPTDLYSWVRAEILQVYSVEEFVLKDNISCCMNLFFLKKPSLCSVNVNLNVPSISTSHFSYSDVAHEHDLCLSNVPMLHTSDSYSPIICPSELLFIEVGYSTKVCIHNFGCFQIPYNWIEVTGSQIDCLEVSIQPNNGYLVPYSNTRFDVYLKPLKVGIIEEIFATCKLSTETEQLLTMRIMCAVEDIICKITIPDINWHVIWPPKMEYDDFEGIDSEHINEFNTLGDNINNEETEINETTNENNEHYNGLINNEIITLITNSYDETTSKELIDSTTESDITTKSSKSLCDYFGDDDLVLQEYLLEFKEVPLRTPVKKTILIENLTPVFGVLDCEVSNFPAADVSPNNLENILSELDIKKFNKWEKLLLKDGLVIQLEMNKTMLEAFSSCEISIFVYGETWGVYADELLIEIGNILPFCISLLVEIVGNPVQFSHAINTIQPYPVLRFGNIPSKSNDRTRTVRLFNSSCVPFKILWHVFIKSKTEKNQAFNVIFDLYESKNCGAEDIEMVTETGELIVTRRYYGVAKHSIFQLTPTDIDIPAKTTVDVKITFSSDSYKENLTILDVNAYLIGNIYLEQSYALQPNLVSRPTGKNLAPVKLKLTCTIESPELIFNTISKRIHFKMYATEIFKKNGLALSQSLMFKNVQKIATKIQVSTELPFHIISVNTRSSRVKRYTNYIEILPDEALEIEIGCIATIDNATDLSKMFYYNRYEIRELSNIGVTNVGEITATVNRSLRIQQIEERGEKIVRIAEQEMPLELLVLYPRIELSTNEMNFGLVYVGIEHGDRVTLRNVLANEVPFFINCPLDVMAKPSSGFLPPCVATGKGHVDVEIFFIPRKSGTFNENIEITTNIPGYFELVNILGLGTPDELTCHTKQKEEYY